MRCYVFGDVNFDWEFGVSFVLEGLLCTIRRAFAKSWGIGLSEPCSFVGFIPVARAIIWPMAVKALLTAGAVIEWPRP